MDIFAIAGHVSSILAFKNHPTIRILYKPRFFKKQHEGFLTWGYPPNHPSH
jgi:hypothetical protein